MKLRTPLQRAPLRHAVTVTLITALASWVASCAPSSSEPNVLRIHAASSLTDAFTHLEATFEQAHPDTDVQLSFAGSQVLRLQIEQGAPTDIFVSADLEHMQTLSIAGHVEAKTSVAHNALTLIVPPSNPARITQFTEVTQAERLVIGTPQSPIGRYTRQLLHQVGTTERNAFAMQALSRVVSQESNARLVRAKVALGEADAAIVYASDAVGREDVVAIPIPPGQNVRAEYVAALTARCGNPAAAQRWLEFLSGPGAQSVLAEFGFEAP